MFVLVYGIITLLGGNSHSMYTVFTFTAMSWILPCLLLSSLILHHSSHGCPAPLIRWTAPKQTLNNLTCHYFHVNGTATQNTVQTPFGDHVSVNAGDTVDGTRIGN